MSSFHQSPCSGPSTSGRVEADVAGRAAEPTPTQPSRDQRDRRVRPRSDRAHSRQRRPPPAWRALRRKELRARLPPPIWRQGGRARRACPEPVRPRAAAWARDAAAGARSRGTRLCTGSPRIRSACRRRTDPRPETSQIILRASRPRPARLCDTQGMTLGYDQKLYILAFDHRGSFQKKFFGIQGEPDAEQTAIIADAKHLIFEGMLQAVCSGADASVTGVLVDEQFGSTVPQEAHERGSEARDARRALGAEHVRLPVRRRLRRAHPQVRPGLHEGARALQPRRRRRRKRACSWRSSSA